MLHKKYIMKKSTPLQMLFAFFLISQFCFAQVDVVYKDLVWSDEFNTNGAVNSTNWFQQTLLPGGTGWFNQEVQHYTNQLANSFVYAGALSIVAKKQSYTDQGVTKQYTSARLNSKFAFKYGRVDIRAKIPKEAGTWPALWMLGKNVNEDGAFFDASYGTTSWPACGEIDILEHGITRSQPDNYIQSAMHTPSSSGNTVNIGGVVVGNNIAENYHIYSMNWSPNQISFLLDGVIFYTYNPSNKNASTWPFDKEQYLLLNIAMGGVAGTIPSNFTQATMLIDYVKVYQNTTVDTQAPSNFTATVGAVSGSSVELLLNATDNSGNVSYNVAYGSGTSSAFSPSGVQKSLVISNLSPNTNYTFNITASDATGNTALNNTIVRNATTITKLECTGTDSQATQSSFTTGYKYAFETIGTDVKITFELLDANKLGVVAYLWKQSPFSESQMTNVSGNIFTKTITGQSTGSTINYGVKFAFSGGMSVTKYILYVVGSSCEASPAASSQTFCGISTVASLVATGTALKWYDVSAGGTALSSSTALTTKTYYVSQTLAGIESTRTAVPVTITPATTTGSMSVSACGSSYTWLLNGQSYTSSGTYTYIVGCNTATLTLVLTPSTSYTTTVSSLNTYTWTAGNGQTYTTSGIKTGATTNCVTELLDLTITTTTQIPTTFPSFCKGATIATAAGSTTLKFYKALTGAAVTATTALATGTYYVTEMKGTSESTPRVSKSIVVNALPTTPSALVLTNPNAALSTTAVTAIGCYVGANKALKLTATAVGASSYNWTLPNGVVRTDADGESTSTIATSTDAVIYVKFTAAFITGSKISVQSVNASGCTSVSKVSSALTSALPSTISKLVLTNGTATTSILAVGPYIGVDKNFTLTATAVTTQGLTPTSYRWVLPAGVSSGLNTGTFTTTSNVITVNFKGVTTPSGTAVLPISVNAVNGVGTSASAKVLNLTRALPTLVAAVAGSLSVCNRLEGFSYTITPNATATKYLITAPAGSKVTSTSFPLNTTNVLTTSDLTFKVVYAGTTAFLSTDKSLTIKTINGVGTSTATKSLALTKLAACTTLTSVSKVAPVASVFKVVAYPNPSTEGFKINSSNKKPFGVQVYDMLGRSIEQRQLKSDSQIGANYARGIYNVIVTQDAQVKTLRLIKK